MTKIKNSKVHGIETPQRPQYYLEHLVIKKFKFVSDFVLRVSNFCLVFGWLNKYGYKL